MAKQLVDDELWGVIEPLLPPLKPRRQRYPGRLPALNRAALTGILFVLKTGIRWNDLPLEMGCDQIFHFEMGSKLIHQRRRMLADALQDIDKVVVGIDVMHATSRSQTLHNTHVLGAEFRPEKKPIVLFMPNPSATLRSIRKVCLMPSP